MSRKRKVEIFTAGCSCCEEAVALVQGLACASCDITVHDMKQESIAKRARELSVKCVPSIVIDGTLAPCCAGGINEHALRGAGIGSPL
jgi:hypothetical protein